MFPKGMRSVVGDGFNSGLWKVEERDSGVALPGQGTEGRARTAGLGLKSGCRSDLLDRARATVKALAGNAKHD